MTEVHVCKECGTMYHGEFHFMSSLRDPETDNKIFVYECHVCDEDNELVGMYKHVEDFVVYEIEMKEKK
jgi:hypothetical protein